MRLNEINDNAGARKRRVRIGRGIGSGVGKTGGRGGKLKAGQKVDVAALVDAGILRRPKDGLRVLGTGELKAKLSVTANGASASAKAAIEKAGGTLSIIEVKVLEADEMKRKKTAAKKAGSAKPTAKSEE